MTSTRSTLRATCGLFTAFALCVGSIAAQEINTNALSENGWFSDDTRADGTGTYPAGTNLISDTLTDDPEATLSGTSAHDADINAQILFGDALGAEPVGTYGGAVHLRIAPAVSAAKSQISHRKDDVSGHGPGSGFGPGFSAEYSWMGDGTVSITASLKFGVKTSEFGLASVSSRTGENVWDKVLIYEPGNLNGGTSDGLWHTETIDYTTGKWWFFDRSVGASNIGTPMTLSDMSTSLVTFSGAKTIKDVYDAITAPGAIITSVQVGIGSANAGGSVYVNQVETNVYRSGMTTTFGMPSPYDQDITPDVIFGSGNGNGSFTVDRQNGVELGMRGKQRFPTAGIYNSNGDGTYTFHTGSGTASFPKSEWSFDFTVNTDYDGSSGWKVGDLTYEIGMDNDPGAGTDYLVFDPIAVDSLIPYVPAEPPVPFWDHSMGDNGTANGGGLEAGDAMTYMTYLATYNVAQNSWQPTFYQNYAQYSWDPDVPGRYEYYLAAFDGSTEVARTAITLVVADGATLSLEAGTCQTDMDPVTPGVQVAFELWMRNPDDLEATGYQAFLDYDDSAMTYVGASSSYASGPFAVHIQDILSAAVLLGELRLDGNTGSAMGPTGDELLATLVFTVAECDPVTVDFDLTQPFASELSFIGVPIVTDLLDASPVIGDDTAPMLAGTPANITQPANAGSCTQAVVSWTDPTATDNCDPSPTVVCAPASGSVFPVGTTTVTCTATDACGNQATSTFDVTVTATNAVDVIVQLQGSVPTSRCIHFVMDDCGMITDTSLTFVGTAPSIAVATIEVPCGVWTEICAKDQQHTQWDSSSLIIVGAKYVASSALVLDGGDTDDDGDVDINDVTLYLAQFGNTAAAGGCPWDGVTRDSDFSNNGAVGSEDYVFLTANWLTTSGCSCSMPNVAGRQRLEQSVVVRDGLTAAADLNRDGLVDVRDVELFEARYGFSGALSERMYATQR